MKLQTQTRMVIRTGFGPFRLSKEIFERLGQRKCAWLTDCGEAPYYALPYNRPELRQDPDLIAVVQELTDELEAYCANVTDYDWKTAQIFRQEVLGELEVVTVTFVVDITQDNGKERLKVHGWAA